MKIERQSDRMNATLESIRALFRDAEIQENSEQMLKISRVLVQQELQLEKLRIREGQYIDRDVIEKLRDEFSRIIIRIARARVPPEIFNEFMDEVVLEASRLGETVDA